MLKDYVENKPVLHTSRLTLRKMTANDIEDLRSWMSDREMYKYWGKSAGRADKDPSLLFAKPDKPTKSFHWGIQKNETGSVIGEMWVYLIENDRMAKVACRIAEKCKGNGYATEALMAAEEFCFENTELHRLWTDVDVRNVPSYRVLEKCGFIREGLIRQGKMVSTWCDYYIYGILREDWERLK